jgi:hypothetical protein
MTENSCPFYLQVIDYPEILQIQETDSDHLKYS